MQPKPNTHFLLMPHPETGEVGRFNRGLSDVEFEPMALIGLLKGWQAVHVEAGETISNSQKVQRLAEYPLVVGVLGPMDPITYLLIFQPDYYLRYAEKDDELKEWREAQQKDSPLKVWRAEYAVKGDFWTGIITVFGKDETQAALRIKEELSKPGRGGYLAVWKRDGCKIVEVER